MVHEWFCLKPRGQLSFMIPSPILDLVEPPAVRLLLTKCLSTFETLQQFSIDFAAVAYGTPEQRQLIVAGIDFRAYVGNEPPGIDPGVNIMNCAAYLFGFAIVERPKSAIGATVIGRKPAVEINHAEPALSKQRSLDERCAEHRNDIGIQALRQRNDLRVIDMRYAYRQVRVGKMWRNIAEEKPCFTVAGVSPPVSQPPPALAGEITRSQQLAYFPGRPLPACFLHDGQRPARFAQAICHVEVAWGTAAKNKDGELRHWRPRPAKAYRHGAGE